MHVKSSRAKNGTDTLKIAKPALSGNHDPARKRVYQLGVSVRNARNYGLNLREITRCTNIRECASDNLRAIISPRARTL